MSKPSHNLRQRYDARIFFGRQSHLATIISALLTETFMHLPTKQLDSMTDLAIKCRGLTDLLLEHLPPCAYSLDVNESDDIFSDQPATRLFRIIECQVSYRIRGKLVTTLEEGDLVGLTRSLNFSRTLAF